MRKLRTHSLFWSLGFGLICLGYGAVMVIHYGRSPWLMGYLGVGGFCWGVLLSMLCGHSFQQLRMAQMGTSVITFCLFGLNLCSWHSWGRPVSWPFLRSGWGQWRLWWEWLHLQPASIWMLILYLGICLLGIFLLQQLPNKWRLSSPQKLLIGLICFSVVIGANILADPQGGPWTNSYRPRMFPPPHFTFQNVQRAINDQQSLEEVLSSPLPQLPHVMVIVADAWRADHLAEYGYERATMPKLSARLKAQPHFQQDWLFSSCAHTACGVPSILQGSYRHEMGQSGLSFFGYLQQLGYETRAYLSGPHRHIWGMNDAFFRHLDEFEDGSQLPLDRQFDDAEVVKQVEALPFASKDSPTALYLHLMSAHTNGPTDSAFFHYLPQQSFGNWEGAAVGTFDPQLTTNTYDNGLLQLDQRLHEILNSLEEKGYLDEAWVLLTGDHGEALGEHGLWGHAYHLFPEMTHVPALIIDSDSTQSYHTQLAGQIDILPTLLDRLQLHIPTHLSGHSWLRPKQKRTLLQQTEYDPVVYGWISETESGLFQYLYQPDREEEWLLPLNLPSDSGVFSPAEKAKLLGRFQQYQQELPRD